MKQIHLSRDSATSTEVTGILTVGEYLLHSIERPWIPEYPGGKPFKSCVPAGRYLLQRHTRGPKNNHDIVPALTNPGHAVFYRKADRSVGRFKILIHSANWAHQVAGCIAPGLAHQESEKGPMVTESRKAMSIIMEYLGEDRSEIIIEWSAGEP